MTGQALPRQGRPPHGGYPGEVVTSGGLDRFMHLLTTVEGVLSLLPPEERAEYERCQQSIIDARDHAQREAHKFWIG